MNYLKRVVLCCWLFGFCFGLKIQPSCLELFLANAEHFHRSVDHIYSTLILGGKPLSGFVTMITKCPAIPYKNVLLRAAAGSLGRIEQWYWKSFKEALTKNGFDINDLFDHAAILERLLITPVSFEANDFRSIDYFPDFVNLERYGAANFVTIMKQLSENAEILSTKILCQRLSRAIMVDEREFEVLWKHFWMLVDTECLEINAVVIRIICNSDPIIEPVGMNGLEPILRMMHGLSLAYSLDDHESDYFFAQELSESFTAFHKYSVALPEGSPLKELYSICVKSFCLFLQQLQLSISDRSTSKAFYKMIWEEVAELRKTSLTINRVLVRFMIVLLGKKPELRMILECLGEVLAQPAHLIPRKDLFALLVALSKRFAIGTPLGEEDEALIRSIKTLIWETGLGPARQERLLLLFPQYFGQMAPLLENDGKRAKLFRTLLLRSGFYRPHLMSPDAIWNELGKIKSYTTSKVFFWPHQQFKSLDSRRVGILTMLQSIANDHFIVTDHGLLPRIDIHLRVELLFWNLIEYAIVLEVSPTPPIHPAYIKHSFFGQGGLRYCPRDFVQLLAESHFSDQIPLDRQIEYFHGLERLFDTVMNRQGQAINASFEDLKYCYRTGSTLCVSQIEGSPSRASKRMKVLAKKMALQVWNVKRGRITRRLWVRLARQDDLVPFINGFKRIQNC